MKHKTNTRVYSDFDLDFIPHPLTGDIVMKYNDEAVKRAIRQLVMTRKYEIPFKPEYGSDLYTFLFDPLSNSAAISLEARIRFLIERYEPRAKLKEIAVIPNSQQDGYDISIKFETVNTIEPIATQLFLQRVR